MSCPLSLSAWAGEPPTGPRATINSMAADFSVSKLVVPPTFAQLAILITRVNLENKQELLSRLRQGFQRVGLLVSVIEVPESDSLNSYITRLRGLSKEFTAAMVIMNNQNKERYDSIKKVASVERGLVTQVMTAKLLGDARRAIAAAIKIAIQLAAKIGGEPWRVALPLKNAMVCGYDSHHDTTKRGLNFGALVASLNATFSRWYSKAGASDRLEDMSTQMAANMKDALNKFSQVNGTLPERVFLYRDGISEGQISHVIESELEQVRRTIDAFDANIKLTIIIVNKRCGVRFYHWNNTTFVNPLPGSVINHNGRGATTSI